MSTDFVTTDSGGAEPDDDPVGAGSELEAAVVAASLDVAAEVAAALVAAALVAAADVAVLEFAVDPDDPQAAVSSAATVRVVT